MAFEYKEFPLSLDLVEGTSAQSSNKKISLSQRDIGVSKILFSLTFRNVAYPIPTGAKVRLFIKRYNSGIVMQDETPETGAHVNVTDATNGKIEVLLNSDSIANAGQAEAQIEIELAAGKIMTSQKFSFFIESALGADGGIISGNDIPLLDRALEMGSKFKDIDLNAVVSVSSDVAELKKYKTGISIEYFGAKAVEDSPGFDSTAAINNAISSVVGELYVPFGKTYDVSTDGVTYTGKGTGIAIKLRDNLRIYGGGTIRLKDGKGGNFTIIGNVTDTIKNCSVEGITIDGNRVNTTTSNRSNLILFGAENCHFHKVTSINTPYVGLMMRGLGGKRNSIIRCLVDNCGYIGVQAQYNDGIIIALNQVYNTVDNAYDIEGNDSAGGFENFGIGGKTLVVNNIGHNVKNGVFLESTGRAIVTGNHFYNILQSGVYLNRINSGSMYSTIADNHIINEVNKGLYSGVRVANSSGRVLIHDNFIKGMMYGVRGSNGATNIVAHDNYFSEISKYLYYATTAANSIVKSDFDRSFYQDAQVNGFPKTSPTKTDLSPYTSRFFNVSITAAKSLDNAAPLRDDYFYKTTSITTSTNPGWAGAFALYSSSETKIWIASNTPNVGDYLKIKNVFYLVYAKVGNEITVRDSSGNAGNFVTALNSSQTVYVYTDSEYNALLND